jgi:neutral ceramidase
MHNLVAGAAVVDISPRDSQFLYGYPHVERYSTGIHDPLLSSAVYLSDGQTEMVFIANDIIFVSKATTSRVRKRISEAISVPGNHIMVTATHTHSGPKTADYISNEHDPVVPKVDQAYLRLFEDGIVRAAVEAHSRSQPAEVGLALADGAGVGTNRRDPSGPADCSVPVLMVRSAPGTTGAKENIACMVVCSMHPTVLHEDSKLVSGDFPAMARQYLQEELLGLDCPVLYHTGPEGNQSPRHVTQANTFTEAKRLGDLLGQAIAQVIPQIEYTTAAKLRTAQRSVDLPRREFPPISKAEERVGRAREKLEYLRRSSAPRQEVRTAEVDWFGAEETLTLARAAQEGRLEAYYQMCLPAEVQVLKIGPWSFVGWPGEMFVEFSLAVKAEARDTFVIALANGELQGYVVTEGAALEGGYEASNAILGPQSGGLLVATTLELLGTL